MSDFVDPVTGADALGDPGAPELGAIETGSGSGGEDRRGPPATTAR